MSTARAIVYMEAESAGHQLDHLRSFVAYEGWQSWSGDVYLAVPPELAPALADVSPGGPFRLHALGPAVDGLGRFAKGVALARRVIQLRRHLGAAAIVHVAHVDPLVPFGAMVGPFARAIDSGVLFRFGTLGRPRWQRRLLRRFLRHAENGVLFSLDPRLRDEGQLPSAATITWLPEPYGGLHGGTESVFATRRPHRWLLFGRLEERKGAITLLEALCLSGRSWQEVEVAICGSVDPAHERVLRAALADTRKLKPSLALMSRLAYLPNGVLAASLSDATAVLAPYRAFEGSSGVLSLAAAHRVPVVTQNHGLVAWTVERYGLGATTDTLDSRSLMTTLEDVVVGGVSARQEGMEEFSRLNGRGPFGRALGKRLQAMARLKGRQRDLP